MKLCIMIVNDKMQKNYKYTLTAKPGKFDDPNFKPALTPKKMLKLGVFEGKYLNDCIGTEFPSDWKSNKMSLIADPQLNFFKIKSRLNLPEWSKRHWIFGPDPRGWFQWYCRYWMGRRIPLVDKKQIARWKAIVRHYAQVVKNCKHPKLINGNCSDPMDCRPKQRQTLLQWSYPYLK